jgi:predicted ATP-dependent serine protease
LTGELRYVAHAERRVGEALKFGLDRVLGPRPAEGTVKGLDNRETVADALRAAGAGRRLREAA